MSRSSQESRRVVRDFSDNLRTTVLSSIKDYRIWLDDLNQSSLQAQTNDFNGLVVLVSELATAKNVVDQERLELNQADEEEKENLPRVVSLPQYLRR